jgi:hypothetical protein
MYVYSLSQITSQKVINRSTQTNQPHLLLSVSPLTVVIARILCTLVHQNRFVPFHMQQQNLDPTHRIFLLSRQLFYIYILLTHTSTPSHPIQRKRGTGVITIR